ncbi:hypothetical protein TNCV_322741 [Trichonephila clavipes]|nr:hypothetical protein TNCV_322741 [Trichonephila clavipes]
MSSSYNFGKRIANDNFQQDWHSRNFPFGAINRTTARRNLPERQEFHAVSLLRDTTTRRKSNQKTSDPLHAANKAVRHT